MLPEVPIRLSTRVKKGSVLGALKGALVGKALRPSEKAWARKYVTDTGAPVRASGSILRNLLIGPREALNILKSRYSQGGVLGKGGLVRGELAPTLALKNTLRRLSDPTRGYGSAGATYSMPGDLARLAGHGTSYGLHLGLGLGLPAVGINQALKGSDPGEGIGRSVGEGLGYLAGGPMGLVGAIGSGILGGEVGSTAGKTLDYEEDPRLHRTAYHAPEIDPLVNVPVYANLPGNNLNLYSS